MDIVLGLDLDQTSYPDALGADPAVIGRVVLGPKGFLDVLETRLGLSRPPLSQALRIAEYQKRLTALAGDHFFSRSLDVDGWSTAKELLAWRDTLFLSGWDGTAPKGAPERIASLAAAENALAVPMPPGEGERLAQVLQGLDEGLPLHIEKVGLIDGPKLWPGLWQRVLEVLPGAGVTVETIDFPYPPHPSDQAGDLGRLSAALQNKDAAKGVTGDGSLVLLQGASENEAAAALAAWVAGLGRQEQEGLVFVLGGGSRVLDLQLRRQGLPQLGHASRSRWRAALQVLPLALSLRWKPFDPQAMLELLSLPRNPLPRFVAGPLQAALLEQPGLGGPAWQEAWKQGRESLRPHLAGDGLEGTSLERKSRAREQELAFWLEAARFDPNQGMDTPVACEVCLRVATWAGVRGGAEEDGLLLSAAQLAREAAAAIQALGVERITRPQLQRLLDSVYASGLEDPESGQQAAPWSVVQNPGQILGPATTIVWWGFEDPGTGPMHTPWDMGEQEWLRARGCRLPDSKAERLRLAATWKRPACLATKQLLLVPPPSVDEEAASHPFLDELTQALGLKDGDLARLGIDPGKSDDIKAFIDSPRLEDIAPRPLPTPEKYWGIPKGLDTTGRRESFSSLNSLLSCPLGWVLDKLARLRGPDQLHIPDGSQLKGTLCHAIVEQLLKGSSGMAPDEAEQRALELFDQLVETTAAPLLKSGSEVDLGTTRKQLGQAVSALCSLINTAGFTVQGCEPWLERAIPGSSTPMCGRVDLVLRDRSGRAVIWDLKWNERDKYKQQELQEGVPLQLAVYAWLAAKRERDYPTGGYFMLKQSRLLALEHPDLPGHACIAATDLEELMNEAMAARDRALKALTKGTAEARKVTSDAGDEPDDRLRFEPNCSWCDFINLCRPEGWQ